MIFQHKGPRCRECKYCQNNENTKFSNFNEDWKKVSWFCQHPEIDQKKVPAPNIGIMEFCPRSRKEELTSIASH